MNLTIGDIKKSIARMEEVWGDIDDLPVVHGVTTQRVIDEDIPYTAPEALPSRVGFGYIEMSVPSPGALLLIGVVKDAD